MKGMGSTQTQHEDVQQPVQLSVESLPKTGHHVYFFDSAQGWCLIGKSSDVASKFSQVQRELPFEIFPLAVFPYTFGSGNLFPEHELKESRVRGSWFESAACRALVAVWEQRALERQGVDATERQLEVLSQLDRAIRRVQCGERERLTVRGLMEDFKVKSPNSVVRFTEALQGAGYLIRVAGPQAWALTDVGQLACARWRSK